MRCDRCGRHTPRRRLCNLCQLDENADRTITDGGRAGASGCPVCDLALDFEAASGRGVGFCEECEREYWESGAEWFTAAADGLVGRVVAVTSQGEVGDLKTDGGVEVVTDGGRTTVADLDDDRVVYFPARNSGNFVKIHTEPDCRFLEDVETQPPTTAGNLHDDRVVCSACIGDFHPGGDHGDCTETVAQLEQLNPEDLGLSPKADRGSGRDLA
jgi:hypothetical protein